VNRERTDDTITHQTHQATEQGTPGASFGHPDPDPQLDRRNGRTKSRKARPKNDPCAAERRNAVEAYMAEVLEKTGERITRADIWKAARYKTRTDFERWQRNDPKATKSANERFTRLLREKPHLQ
jgi:hypothetical protein